LPRGGQNAALPICLVERNPLGLEYLLSLLRKVSSVRVVRTEELDGRSKDSVTAVIVVDNCGLPLPLSEALRRLRCLYPTAKYLVLDHNMPREDLLRLLWMKIDGFLPYEEVPRSLITAIHSIADGNIWIPRDVLREYVQQGQYLRLKDASHTHRMTARENQIVELVKRRLSNKEIADILGIREATVKFHLSNIYSKISITSRHEIIDDNTESAFFGIFTQLLAPSGSKA
jgi:DNA-binding NarL/FixJ family response regulator